MSAYKCLLYWRTFDGPGDLAAHEEAEDHVWPLDVYGYPPDQPSTKADTI